MSATVAIKSGIDADNIDTELVGTTPTQRNWRGILIALLVILIVLSLIIVAVILVTPKQEDVFIGEPFTIDDMFNDKYKPRTFKVKWSAHCWYYLSCYVVNCVKIVITDAVPDKDIYVYRSKEGEVMEYNVEQNESTIIMDNSTFRELNTDVYFVSEDLQYILIAYQIESIYRHSFIAKYKIYNRNAQNKKQKLMSFPQSLSNEWRNKKLQYAEEILHTHIAHWWSPQGSYIAYLQFNDTLVPKYRFPYYGDGKNIYGDIEELSYPKAGDKGSNVGCLFQAGDKGSNINPKVNVYLVETGNLRVGHRKLPPPEEFRNKEVYVTSVVWQDDSNILVVWLNRAQNITIVSLCEAFSADCHTPTPKFIEGGQTYLTRLPGRDGHHGYWKHIAMVTAPLGLEMGHKIFVTQGPFDVLEIVGFDEEQKIVYFITNYISDLNAIDPRKRHLYAVVISDRDLSLQEPQCITCNESPDCQYVSASFSYSGQYYILECLGPGIPFYKLRSTIDDRDIVVEDNADIKTRLAKKALPFNEYFEIEHPTQGHIVWAKVLLPRTLVRDHIIKYPLLVQTYAAPETQKVTEEFHTGWETVLVSSQNVIYAFIDGRGSLGRGDQWLHQLYRQLGTKEVDDQALATEFLRNKFHYIDDTRIAVWGWSYGGFVSSHLIGRKGSLFTCGIAVAPVTDWRYYDTAYTERYMGLSSLEENFRGYDNANVSRKAGNFRGKKFLIVHGTADDNVHYQHTAQFTKALTAADVDFSMQIYSDKKHTLKGFRTTRHLYHMMTSFLQDTCWNGGAPFDPNAKKGDKKEDEKEGCPKS
ncbi:hypothetical protein LSH36_197g03008 [Paralvinella palmiformis]|uniref:Uncharacterized protein n=1 Tax=Paralvinella palmiformis TaxID=53620 RepID=A0AAD9N548_9ANNE|nr:hypothetical protein LSH36_197g03008 [Paralvinella palmiformis]